MSSEISLKRIKVVLLEDNPRDAEINVREVRRAGFDPDWVRVETEETFLAALNPPPDLIISDYSLPQFDGLRAVDVVRGLGLNIPFILVSGMLGEDAAIDAMKRGVDDYLLKSSLLRLGTSVVSALDKKHRQDEQKKAEDDKRTAEERLRVTNEMLVRILDALPAHIAVLDSHGVIVTVNEAWRRFVSANVLQSSDFFMGQNYLGVCERAHGECADEAQAVAVGIRSVLSGEEQEFALEYPCHSPDEQLWFRMMVTPLSTTLRSGVVVMHVNVTERRLAEEILSQKEREQRRLAEDLTIETQRLHESQAVANVGSWETNLTTLEVAWTDETFRIFETNPEEFKATHQGVLARIHPEDRQRVDDAFKHSHAEQGPFAIEHRLLFPDGRIKFVEERWQAFHDATGRPARAVGTCQDITQRKMAEQAVSISEASLARAQRIASMGNWDWNIVTGKLSWSAHIYELFGINPTEEVGTYERFISLVHPEDRERIRQAVTDAVERRAPYDVEHRVLRPDGTVRVMHELGEVTRDPAGRPLNMIGTVQDITERKAAADQLRTLSQAVEQSPSTIIITDLAGNIEYVNPKFTELSGYSAAEVIGKNPRILNAGAGPSALYRELWATITAGKPWRGEMQNRKKNGETYWEEASITPVLNAEGKVAHFLGVKEDISERRAKEAQLRLLETCISRLNDIVLITEAEPQDDPGPRILYVNDAFVRRTGFTREEVIGKTPRLLQGPKTQRDALDRIRAALKAWQPCREELINYTKSGVEFWLELEIVPVADATGWYTHWVAIERDITERKNLERQRLRTQRLESIGTLVGGIAHDLNNALAPIMMSVELLREKYPVESETIDMIDTSVMRGAHMVRQLVSFAKGAEGERVILQPGPLLRELENLMKGSFPKNVQLLVKYDAELPTIVGDATQVHQVLLNLCVNARDAMPNGGTLKLEARRMAVDAAYARSIPSAKPGDYLLLRVSDTGAGIPSEILDRIFDPFFSTKGLDKGTGLGLSTVMGIVKGYGGFLQVYSQLGQGSTFNVYLPAVHAGNSPERITKAEVGFRGQGETILLVDDEANMRESASTILRRLNFNPLTATDGADGLYQAAEHRSKLRAVVTDLHMPHMDGLTFVRVLRRMLPAIPVIVASGRMEDELVAEFKALGVTTHLEKPYTEAQLNEALQSLLAPK